MYEHTCKQKQVYFPRDRIYCEGGRWYLHWQYHGTLRILHCPFCGKDLANE